MKIAFVHCWTLPGGALDVFKDLIDTEKFENGKIFTLVSPDKTLKTQKHELDIITALPRWINNLFLFFTKHKVPVISKIFDYRNLIVFYPCLMRRLSKKIKRYWAEKAVISSFAIAKNIDFKWYKKLYLHSPMQYIRSHYDEYIAKLSRWQLAIFRKIKTKLRKWDMSYDKFDEVYSNSQYTADLAKEIYNIESKVKYPRIDDTYYLSTVCMKPLDYYVFLGRLTSLVREADKIIELFNQTGKPLLLIWSGPDEEYLKSIAKDNIIFLWRIQDKQEIINILKQARWLVNLTKESFGMNTCEALLLWVPVFGFNGGATTELINEDTGVLVDVKDSKSLESKFYEFDAKEFDRRKVTNHIRKILS